MPPKKQQSKPVPVPVEPEEKIVEIPEKQPEVNVEETVNPVAAKQSPEKVTINEEAPIEKADKKMSFDSTSSQKKGGSNKVLLLSQRNRPSEENANIISLNKINIPQTKIHEASEFEERRKLREARFGMSTANQTTTVEAQQIIEEDKKKRIERTKRFGGFSKEDEDDKKKKRLERFKTEGGAKSERGEDFEKLKKAERMKRFNIINPETEEEKKKMRALKFASTYSDSSAIIAGSNPRKKFKK